MTPDPAAVSYTHLDVYKRQVLGVVVLKERLNRVQWLSVCIATIGVLWLTFSYGRFPWIALVLACSFGAYGLVRKLLGVPPVRGLGVELSLIHI